MKTEEQPCPSGDGNVCPQGQALCGTCADRLWQELYWLAEVYPVLLDALVHKVNVEHREELGRAAPKDPLTRGLDLHEDALHLRTRIRSLAYSSLGWLLERGYTLQAGVSASVEVTLKTVARNLLWLLTDPDQERLLGLAALAVEYRLAAEGLTTPAGVAAVHLGLPCDRHEGNWVCGGRLVLWPGEQEAYCLNNPAHTVSRETLVLRVTRERRARGTTATVRRS